MKVEVRRKIFSVIMAMSVFISALAMPVFFRDVPGVAVAYADEYTGLRVNNTGAINTRQDDECQISMQITNTRDAEFSFDGAKLEFSKTEGLTISGGTKATVSFASRDDQAEISFTVKANRFVIRERAITGSYSQKMGKLYIHRGISVLIYHKISAVRGTMRSM